MRWWQHSLWRYGVADRIAERVVRGLKISIGTTIGAASANGKVHARSLEVAGEIARRESEAPSGWLGFDDAGALWIAFFADLNGDLRRAL